MLLKSRNKYLFIIILFFVFHVQVFAQVEIYQEKISGSVVSFEMVKIPADENAQTKAFWVGRTEVTWELFDIYVYGLDLKSEGGVSPEVVTRPSKPYVLPGRQFGHQGFPALAMTYFQAENFVKWLSAKTGKKYRLLQENEWERICKADTSALANAAWFWDNAEDKTHKVGTKSANALGAFDMRGNVGEWVQGRDGVAVLKGGSWTTEAKDTTCEARQAQQDAWNATDPQLPKSRWWLPDAPFVGFRVAMDE